MGTTRTGSRSRQASGLRALALAGAGVWILACAGTSADKGESRPAEALIEVDVAAPGEFWVRPGVDVDDYDDWIIGDVGISYARRQHPLDPEESQRLVAMVQAALRAVLEDRGQDRAIEPGPCTAKLDVHLGGLELYESQTTGSSVTFIRSYGRVNIVTDVVDSQSGDVLSRYAEERSLGSGVEHGRVEPNLDRLVKVLVLVLRQRAGAEAAVRARGRASPGASPRCAGRIGSNREQFGSW